MNAYPYINGDTLQKLIQILENNISSFETEITHLHGKLEEAKNILGTINYMTESKKEDI